MRDMRREVVKELGDSVRFAGGLGVVFGRFFRLLLPLPLPLLGRRRRF
jgi:hypothetical protein